MIFQNEDINTQNPLPSKEVFVEDMDEQLSYPGDMADEDIQFHLATTVYKKPIGQAIKDVFTDLSFWEKQEQKAKDLIQAVPDFMSAISIPPPEDFRLPVEEQIKQNQESLKLAIDSGSKIGQSLFETFLGRRFEPIRKLASDVVTGQTEDVTGDLIKAVIDPSSVKEITSPEIIPFAEWERNGGVVPLIPRAVLNAVENVIVYSADLKKIPALIENYKISTGKQIVKNHTEEFVKMVRNNSPMDDMQAMEYLSRPDVLKYIEARVNGSTMKFYGGLPVPENLGGAAKEVGKEAVKALAGAGKNPNVLAKVGSDFVKAQLEKENVGRTLSPDEIKAQDFVVNNYEEAKKNYVAESMREFKSDNIISSDIGKFAIPEMTASKSAAHHEAGSALAKSIAKEKLSDPELADLPVGFTAGGSGSGKSNILRSAAEKKGSSLSEEYAIVYDTNMDKYDSAKAKIEESLRQGREVEVTYVYRDILKSWEEGVIPRVKEQNRIVPIKNHIETHKGSLETVKRLAKEYENNASVLISGYDNSFEKGKAQQIDIDNVPQGDYTSIEDKLYDATKKAFEQGKINEQEFKTAVTGVPSLEKRFADDYPNFKAENKSVVSNVPRGSPVLQGQQPSAPQVASKQTFKERSFVSSIKEEKPQLKVSGQYIPRSTDELAQKARTLIQENIDVAEKMALSGLDDASIATGAELLKFYCDEASKSIPAVANVLYEKATTLGNNMAERLTELGRSVQAAAILGRLTPAGQLRFAAKTIKKYNEQVEKDSGLFGIKKKIPELTPTQTKDILKQLKEIALLPDGEAKAIKFKDLQNYISDLVPTPLYKKIVTIWKAGLLTGLKTSGVNILSNFSHAFGLEVLKDIPASAVDSVASLFTNKRTLAFTTKGLASGGKEGFLKGLKFLKTGYDERNALSKLDYERVNFGKGKIGRALQGYEEFVFNLLGAEDQVFYYGAKSRSIIDQAIAQGKNSKLKGKQLKDFVNNLIENPTDDMLVYSISDAQTAVFQNQTELSKAASSAKKGAPILEFILPFSKTPSAVAMQIINYSPAGIVKTIIQNIGKGKFDQREFSQGMGRGLTGTAILAIGFALAEQGRVSLDRPVSESDKKLWELEGRKPNSIKIGDKWRSIQVLGPAGNVILVGAQFQKSFAESGSPTEAVSKGLGSSIKSFSEQTYLSGLSSATQAVQDPQRYAENYTSSLAGSFVPTIIADIARATDSKERRTESIAQRVMSRIPILRQQLEPQVDVLGREKFIKENFFETMADPSRPMTINNDPVVSEIRRLEDGGNNVATSQLGTNQGFKILTQKQNTELWQNSGQIAYDKIISYMDLGSYEELPDDQKAKDINKIFDQSKIVARASMLLELTKDLEGAEVIKVLKEAKEQKLNTREVYAEYQRMR